MLRLCTLVVVLVLVGCGDDTAATTGSPGSTTSSTSAGGGGSGGSGGQGGAGPDTITFTTYVGSAQENLLFVAAQDGDEAWEPLAGTDGVYSFTTSGRFGIAYVCVEPGSAGLTALWVVQATTMDFTSLVRVCMGPPPGMTTSVSGQITGIGSGDTVSITMGPYAGAPGVTSTYQMMVPQGTWDLAAIHDLDLGAGPVADHIIVRRDVVVAGTPVNENFDFATQGVATAQRSMTINGATASDTVVMNSFLRLEDGGGLMLNAPNPNFAVVPSSVLSGNDTHFINCFVSSPTDGLRAANTNAKDPQDVTFTLLEPLDATVTLASSSPIQFEASYTAVSEAQRYGLSIGQNTTTARRLFVAVSAAWLGSGAMLTYTTPDVTTLAGWDPSWELSPGEVTDWFAGVHASSARFEYDDKPTPGPDPSLEGVVSRFATSGGQLTP